MDARQIPIPWTPVDRLWTRAAQAAQAVLAQSIHARGGRTLPRLSDDHPCASRAPRRWRGLGTVPVAAIVGTASFQPGTRRPDFQPIAGHAPADWQSRWRRLETAADDLTPLPPVDLIKAGDGYWVVDGHNRVALAKATGQLWIDADVTELLLPRQAAPSPLPQGGTN